MTLYRACLPLFVLLFSSLALAATEIGVITLLEGNARVLRDATWYKVATGLRIVETDILALTEGAQVQLELASGTVANLAGSATVYLAPAPAAVPRLFVMPSGWLKVAAKAPGVRVRGPAFDVATADGILVVREQPTATEAFVEAGNAKVYEPGIGLADGAVRDAKRGEFWAKQGAGAFTTIARAPRTFVDAMPRHFLDPLPTIAGAAKARPPLVVDHDITYAEAEPWLTRDRPVFERRFASRLRDPVFRKAVEPHIARYPAWDRMLHPEKYAPKKPPVKSGDPA